MGQKELKIDKDEFVQWKSSPITAYIFQLIEQVRNGINESLGNAELIMKDDGGKSLARILGHREGLDLLLNVEFEQLEASSEEKEDE